MTERMGTTPAPLPNAQGCRCPFCNRLMMRVAPRDATVTIEVECGRCHGLSVYGEDTRQLRRAVRLRPQDMT